MAAIESLPPPGTGCTISPTMISVSHGDGSEGLPGPYSTLRAPQILERLSSQCYAFGFSIHIMIVRYGGLQCS